MAQQLEMLGKLKSNPEPANVENVLGAWEDAARLLNTVEMSFHAVRAADTTDDLEAIAEEVATRLANHNDEIYLDERLFARVSQLRTRARTGEIELDAQDDWALAELERSFIRSGIGIPSADQTRLRELNERIAELSTRFATLTRSARNAGRVTLSDGRSIELINTSQHPALAEIENRDDRRRLHESSVTRSLGGEFDTRGLIVEIARARAERAKLLGYPHHSAYVAADGVARTTEAVNELLGRIGPAAVELARAEEAELRDRFNQAHPGEEFQPWDWAWSAALVRKEKFDFDESALSDELGVDKVLDAVFMAASELYGISFEYREDLLGHTGDAKVYEVVDHDRTLIGLFVMDLWARPSKGGGAWMNSLVLQSDRYGELPVVTNNCNLEPGSSFVSWDMVITMFHEFGHALHGLFSAARYPSRSGTHVPRDFVEFPSQVNEWWAWQPGRVVDQTWIDKLRSAEEFGRGFALTELLMASVIDQTWHQTPLEGLPVSADQVEEFERDALRQWGMDYDLIPPRYRSQYFSHIWGGGYSAGYYGYTWSEMMDADAVAWFVENGGCTRENGDHFRSTLLAPGGSVDPAESFRAFRGRDPELAPLLARLGLDR